MNNRGFLKKKKKKGNKKKKKKEGNKKKKKKNTRGPRGPVSLHWLYDHIMLIFSCHSRYVFFNKAKRGLLKEHYSEIWLKL